MCQKPKGEDREVGREGYVPPRFWDSMFESDPPVLGGTVAEFVIQISWPFCRPETMKAPFIPGKSECAACLLHSATCNTSSLFE